MRVLSYCVRVRVFRWCVCVRVKLVCTYVCVCYVSVCDEYFLINFFFARVLERAARVRVRVPV